MATLTTGNIHPLLILALRAGFGQGQQQGFQNLLMQREMRIRQGQLDVAKKSAKAAQLSAIGDLVAAGAMLFGGENGLGGLFTQKADEVAKKPIWPAKKMVGGA